MLSGAPCVEVRLTALEESLAPVPPYPIPNILLSEAATTAVVPSTGDEWSV
jgi:hypothetical protein